MAYEVLPGIFSKSYSTVQPTKFDFVIYLKARALGLELSPSLVGLADEVIEISTTLSFLTPRRTFAVQILPEIAGNAVPQQFQRCHDQQSVAGTINLTLVQPSV